MQPKVSVLIPTFNSEQYLTDAIESVLAQTYSNFELIIVDNASTDNTESLVYQYLKDPRVSYYRNEKNIGMAANWNRCLELSSGKYIKFLMSDDKFHPDLILRYVDVMEQHTNVALVSSDRYIFGQNQASRIFETPLKGLQPGTRVIYETLNSWNWIGEPTTVMFRRENLHLGKFNPAFKYYLDWDMWLRHLTVGDCYFIPEVLSYFRIHEGQTTSLLKQNYTLFFEEYEFYQNLKQNKPYDIIKAGFDPNDHIKAKSSTLFKIGIKLFLKGKFKKWRTATKAMKLGWKGALLPDARSIALFVKSIIGKMPV